MCKIQGKYKKNQLHLYMPAMDNWNLIFRSTIDNRAPKIEIGITLTKYIIESICGKL